MSKLYSSVAPPVARQAKEILVNNFSGLDTTTPYDLLKDGVSPYMYNARLFARNINDRRVSIATRKGPGYYSATHASTTDINHASVTGASLQSVTDTFWVADKLTPAGKALDFLTINLKLGATAPTQHLLVSIYTDNAGSPGTVIATSSILSSLVASGYAYIKATFTSAPVFDGVSSYWVVLHMQLGGAGSYSWSSNTTATTAKTSSDSGVSWNATTVQMNLTLASTTASRPVLGAFRYIPSSGTAVTVFACNNSVDSVNESTGALTNLVGTLSTSATDYYFSQTNDIMYATNGVDVPQQWNGATWGPVATGSGGISIPAAKFNIQHRGRMFLAGLADPTQIMWSEIGRPDTFLSTSFTNVPASKTGDPITGWMVFQDNLVIFTKRNKWIFTGQDPGNFTLIQATGKKGAVNQDVIASDPNYIYFLSDDGVYRFDGSTDLLLSDKIYTEITNMAFPTKAAAVVQGNYYRLYYAATGSTVNNQAINWDIINNAWLRDNGTYITKPIVDESGRLIEGSSEVGRVYIGEVAFSDIGAPIAFQYYTKYFGDGLHKFFMRRAATSIRLQSRPHNIDVFIDIDQRNTNSLSYTINAAATGYIWGGGATWGGGAVWGSEVVSVPTILRGTEALWQQIRYQKTGVDIPVEILDYLIQIRSRRIR